MDGDQAQEIILETRGIVQADGIRAKDFGEQLVPLVPEHVVVVANSARLGQERDHFRQQETVNAVQYNVKRGIVGEDEINDRTVALEHGAGQFRGM